MNNAWKLFSLDGRDRFDIRLALIRTFTEAAYWINGIALPFGALDERRNQVYLLYAEDTPFHLSWQIYLDRNIGGIRNYDENILPNLLLHEGVKNFIIEKLRDEEDIHFLKLMKENKKSKKDYLIESKKLEKLHYYLT